MQCYGREYGKLTECATCEYVDYCKDAGDPQPVSQIQYDDSRSVREEKPQLAEPEHTYTADQMADLFRRLIYLDDPRLRTIIQLKVENPSISFSEIAAHYGISKQAIHQYVKQAVAMFPELKVVLQNRPIYNRWRRYTILRKREKRDALFSEQMEFQF